MPNVLLLMSRKPIAQDFIYRLRDSPDIKLIYETDYNKANILIGKHRPKVALIEAAESGDYDMVYCLQLCKKLRRESPKCKLLLMCSEQDEKCVKGVVTAKAERYIDDFVFYDVTIDYLASKLISM